jgi:cbb3-type cytochrome oxidase subunit 3
MDREDSSWVTTIMMLVILAAVAWLLGGGVRLLLLTLGESRDFASDIGAISAIVGFLLLLGAYFFYTYVPRATGDSGF